MTSARPVRYAEAYRCGRLYAVIAALQRLAENEHHELGRPQCVERAATRPEPALRDPLRQVGHYLVRARIRGRGAAADPVFRSIPDFLPEAREVPAYLSAEEREDFHRGREEQAALIAKEYPAGK
ncbi:type I-C CRISPR-associated protein Cas8c/Csd1 [Streptomyces sp. ML-6]|uniref:type I-C CRISPR-associated protein Cas8c/Csd1 n=1 Tax=Streptomyces sp. ML-6 TaxID=2982693 RepID=UPI0024BFB885|nr:type I-C CRISPR-associated protein Cas8c/Csd1 [Streptomyces sp. ML-6]MDK0519596.1 type I-C CRISPR-associated protein Cas8c/Csd1 [Streptomyces sp. ML-6]